MDSKYFREKADLCERLADGLSLKNPARIELTDLAEYLRKHAKEFDAQETEQQSKLHKAD